MQSSHGFPDLRQLAWPGTGVMDLAAQNQKGVAIDKQCIATIPLFEVRGFGGPSGRESHKNLEKSYKKDRDFNNRHEVAAIESDHRRSPQQNCSRIHKISQLPCLFLRLAKRLARRVHPGVLHPLEYSRRNIRFGLASLTFCGHPIVQWRHTKS